MKIRIVLLIVLGIVIIGVSGYFIFRKPSDKKRKKGEKDNKLWFDVEL